MNNQQESFNSPSRPGMGESETEHQRIAPRLRPKTKLRGLSQQRAASATGSPSQEGNDHEKGSQSFIQTPEPWIMPDAHSLSSQQSEPDTETFPQPQPLSWTEMATRAFRDAQQPLGETTTQQFTSPAQSPYQDTSTSDARQVQPSLSSDQASHNTSRFNKPKFSKSAFSKRNGQRISDAGLTADIQAAPHTHAQANPNPPANSTGTPSGMYPNPNVTRNLNSTGTLPGPTGALGQTGALMHPAGEYSGDTGMLKLNQAVKVVRIPVAGKPGEYKTGILPVQAQSNTSALPPPTMPEKLTFQERVKKNSKLVALVTLIVLILFSSGIYLLTRTAGNTTTSINTHNNTAEQASLNASATANVQATAAFEKSLLINDSLSSNTREWLTTQNGDNLTQKGIKMFFQNNAYHISSTTTRGIAYFADAVLLNEKPPINFTLSVDTQQIKGNENSQYNFYGLLFSYVEINGHPIAYAFRVINNKSDQRYEFCTFDSRRPDQKWSEPIWKKSTGKEFHGGKGTNNLKVQVNGHNFTFYVNNQKLGSVKDTKYGPGAIGLGVNGLPDGSEVAFSYLLLTSN